MSEHWPEPHTGGCRPRSYRNEHQPGPVPNIRTARCTVLVPVQNCTPTTPWRSQNLRDSLKASIKTISATHAII